MSPIATFGRFLLRLLGFALAAVLAVAGLVLMSGVLLLIAALALGLYVWLRWRGRATRPVRFVWRRTTARAYDRPGDGPSRPGRSVDAEVVDVRYTEVDSTHAISGGPVSPRQDGLPAGPEPR